MKYSFVFLAAGVFAVSALAKIPVPAPSDEAKAKAAEAAAKAAHAGKVEAYQLCKSMDKTAAYYYKTAKSAGKDTKPPVATPPCADPGPFASTTAAPAATNPSPAKAAAAAKKKS